MANVIEGLDSSEYEHPADKQALDAVKAVRGLKPIVGKIHELGFEKFLRLEFVGSNLKVTSGSFPDIYEVFEDAYEILDLQRDLRKTPELYVRYNDYFRTLDFSTNNLEGITVGVNNPVVIISIDCVETFSESELLFILGCQIGRIKSQHILYQDIASLLPLLGSVFGIVGAPVLGALGLALKQWLRVADYTADRAGLLACQDVDAALMAMAKIAGLPKKYFDSFRVSDFATQAKEFEGLGGTLYSQAVKSVSSLVRDQAFTVARAHELQKWIDSRGYQDVLDRKSKTLPGLPLNPESISLSTTPSLTAPPHKFCHKCGNELQPSHNFCTECGERVST